MLLPTIIRLIILRLHSRLRLKEEIIMDINGIRMVAINKPLDNTIIAEW